MAEEIEDITRGVKQIELSSSQPAEETPTEEDLKVVEHRPEFHKTSKGTIPLQVHWCIYRLY